MSHHFSFKCFLCFCILSTLSSLNCKNDLPDNRFGVNTEFSNQKKKIENAQTQSSLAGLMVGTWDGIIEGDKLVWTVNSDGTERYKWFHPEFTQKGYGTWELEGDILHESWATSSDICRIKFITEDHMLLTVLENGNPKNVNQERHYYRKGADSETYNDENKSNKINRVSQKITEDHHIPPPYTTTCITCAGKCVVPFEVGYDTSCLTISEIQQAMSNSISADPVRVWVRCCSCKGQGAVTMQ